MRGMPSDHRLHFWVFKTRVCQVQAINRPDFFSKVVKKATTFRHPQEIKNDVRRTFNTDPAFSGNQASLKLLLETTCLQIQTGYTQGLNYVAAIVLRQCSFEPEPAFWVLV